MKKELTKYFASLAKKSNQSQKKKYGEDYKIEMARRGSLGGRATARKTVDNSQEKVGKTGLK